MTSISGNNSNLDKLLNRNKNKTDDTKKNTKKKTDDSKSDKTTQKTKYSEETKRIYRSLISADEVLKRVPGLSMKQAKDIAERLNDKFIDDAIGQKGLAKPKTLNQLRNERLQSLLGTNNPNNTKALGRIRQAVQAMSPAGQAEMAELAMEFQILQTKIVGKAREMLNKDVPKTDWQKIKAAGQQEQLLDLIKQSDSKRADAIKKLAQSYK